MFSHRRHFRTRVLSPVLFGVVVVGCAGSEGRPFYGRSGAPIAIEADEGGFRDAMSSYGLKTRQTDCIIDALAPTYQLREASSTTPTSPNHTIAGRRVRIPGDAIAAAAEHCQIGTSKLRNTTD